MAGSCQVVPWPPSPQPKVMVHRWDVREFDSFNADTWEVWYKSAHGGRRSLEDLFLESGLLSPGWKNLPLSWAV